MENRIEVGTSRKEVVLRQFVPEDAEPLFALIERNRAHLSKLGDVTASKYPTYQKVLKSITHPENPKRVRFGIWVDSQLAGSVNLTPSPDMDGMVTIGYWVGKEYCSQGLATLAARSAAQFAFAQMRADYVFAETHKDNKASQRVLVKAGFEGRSGYRDKRYFIFASRSLARV